MNARVDKWHVLKVLFDRAVSGNSDISLTAPTIATYFKGACHSAVVQMYCEELIQDGFVSQPERGVRPRFQVTSAGIKEIDRQTQKNEANHIDSKLWTGATEFSISEEKQKKIVESLYVLKKVIENTDLTNSERSQAVSCIASAIVMAEAPKPAWHIIKETLLIIASISTAFSLALQIAGMIS